MHEHKWTEWAAPPPGESIVPNGLWRFCWDNCPVNAREYQPPTQVTIFQTPDTE
jgi:hypothetical protein